jgi:hypothetical protein
MKSGREAISTGMEITASRTEVRASSVLALALGKEVTAYRATITE